MDLTPEDLELLSSFIKKDKAEGVILLDVNNPLPCLVAFRVGWFMEGSLEYYTPWTPVTPDYLKVVATYLAWIGAFRNVMIKCQIKAISPSMKDIIYNSIHDVFNNFACRGNVQEGTISPDGTIKMEDKSPFCSLEGINPPRVTISFDTMEARELKPVEKELIESLNDAFQNIIDRKGRNLE